MVIYGSNTILSQPQLYVLILMTLAIEIDMFESTNKKIIKRLSCVSIVMFNTRTFTLWNFSFLTFILSKQMDCNIWLASIHWLNEDHVIEWQGTKSFRRKTNGREQTMPFFIFTLTTGNQWKKIWSIRRTFIRVEHFFKFSLTQMF